MTNTPIDYTARMRACEARIETLGEDLDPADVFGVASLICDSFFDGNWDDFLRSHICKDLLSITQSNFARGRNRLVRMVRLDEAISRYDDEMIDPNLP